MAKVLNKIKCRAIQKTPKSRTIKSHNLLLLTYHLLIYLKAYNRSEHVLTMLLGYNLGDIFYCGSYRRDG